MKKSIFRLAASVLFCLLFAAVSFAGEIIPAYEGFNFTVSAKAGLIVQCKTNLPDGTALSVGLWQRSPKKFLYEGMPLDYPKNFDTLVNDGAVAATFPTAYVKGLPAGNYDVSISIIQLQRNAPLGEKNSLLSGPEVKTLENGYKEHTAMFPVKIAKAIPPHPKKLPE